MEKTRKKIITFILITLTFTVAFAQEKDFISLYNFNTMKTQQEIVISRYDIICSKIVFYIHLKMNDDYVYVLKHADDKMMIRKVSKENYRKVIYRIKQLLVDKKVSEFNYPISDDASNVTNIVFKGELDFIINPFNEIMLEGDDYRELLCREITKLID